MNEIRKKIWILGLCNTLRSISFNCVICKKLRARPPNPLMSDFSSSRLAFNQRPFTHCGVNYFGSLLVKIGRRQEKRDGGFPEDGALYLRVCLLQPCIRTRAFLKHRLSYNGITTLICEKRRSQLYVQR